MIKPQRSNAIAELSPLTTFSFDGEGNIVEWDTGETKSGLSQPTNSEIDAKLSEMISEYDAQEYYRNRAKEFPELKEQLDLLFHDMTAGKGDKSGEWYKAVSKVKTDNPKPE